MKHIKAFPIKATAILGSLDDNPKRKVDVVVICDCVLPGFYQCKTTAGVWMTVHRDKLKFEGEE